MDGILILSKKTYSLAKKKPMTIWIEKEYSINNLNYPADFEIKLVNFNINLDNSKNDISNDIRELFPDLRLSWSERDNVKEYARALCSYYTDIAWYVKELNIAFVLKSHVRMHEILYVESIDSLKKILK